MKLNKLIERRRLRKCKMLDNLKDLVESFIVANRYLDKITLQQASSVRLLAFNNNRFDDKTNEILQMSFTNKFYKLEIILYLHKIH